MYSLYIFPSQNLLFFKFYFRDIVGYVAKNNNNFLSPRAAKFQKFVINNAKGREVEIIAWNQNTKILKPITEMGLVSFYIIITIITRAL